VYKRQGYYLLLLPFLISRDGWRKIVGGLRFHRHQAVLAVLTAILFTNVWAGGNRDLEVSFVDVGQGDSIWIELPGSGTILVDGGGKRDAEALQKFLAEKGATHIDLVVLTHPEADHIGELPEVLAKYPVRLLIESGRTNDTQIYRKLAGVIQEKKVPTARVRSGLVVQGCPEVRLRVLHPESSDLGETSSLNDSSVVLLLEYGSVGVLLTGDIGFPSEREIMESHDDLDCTVLKVPHHGSRYSTSSDFLDITDPEIAVIEVGKNSYGHPTPETMERLDDCGAIAFRTDRDGTVRFVSDGKTYRVFAEHRVVSYIGEEP